jgi:hypothetical protein
MFMFNWSTLMTPPEGHPGQHAYTFVIRILSTSALAPKFQHSLPAITLGIYLGGAAPLLINSL